MHGHVANNTLKWKSPHHPPSVAPAPCVRAFVPCALRPVTAGQTADFGPTDSTNAKAVSEPRTATRTGDQFRNPELRLILRFCASNFASKLQTKVAATRTGGFALVDFQSSRCNRSDQSTCVCSYTSLNAYMLQGGHPILRSRCPTLRSDWSGTTTAQPRPIWVAHSGVQRQIRRSAAQWYSLCGQDIPHQLQ